MGCDIHLYVEKRVNPSHDWESADKWTTEKGATRPTVDYGDHFYNDRCYSLFAMLADVRNGHGFAGIKTGEGFVPIAIPRGLPQDVSPNLAAECKDYGVDGHSHSYLTLEELLAYDWTQESMLLGHLHGYDYREWNRWARKRGHSPNSWAGSIGGGGIMHITNQEMEQIIVRLENEAESLPRKDQEQYIKDGLRDYVTECTWSQKYYQCAAGFLSTCLPRLLRLGKPENVRIVFWFDN